MNFKALLFLAMLLASILVISAEVAPKDLDDYVETNGVDESKYVYRGGGYGGPWRRGGGYPHGGYGYCRYGCCGWGYHGGCRRCCYYPGEHLETNTDAEPHN